MDREREEIFGDYRPPQVRGIMQMSVTVSSDVAGVRSYEEATCRRIITLEMAPCPKELASVMGSGVGSMIHANPVEISRRVRSWRTPIPTTAAEETEALAGPAEEEVTP
jgi:hypothetical protein